MCTCESQASVLDQLTFMAKVLQDREEEESSELSTPVAGAMTTPLNFLKTILSKVNGLKLALTT